MSNCQLRRWRMSGKLHSQLTARISMLRSAGQLPTFCPLHYFLCRFFKDFRPFFFLCQLTGMFPYKLQRNLPFSWYLISFEKTFENTQWWKSKQLQPMWQSILWGRQFEDTFENTQRRKAEQMQPMWLCNFLCTKFENTFKNPQRRKVKQMQPVWLCLLWPKFFVETYEEAQTSVESHHLSLHKSVANVES